MIIQIERNDVLTKLCDDRMRRSLDIHAPIQTKIITTRQTNPWFTENARSLKKAVRGREKIWHKYKTEDAWLAYKIVKSTYRKACKEAKMKS